MNTMTEQYIHTTIDSPIGELLLVGDGRACAASTCRRAARGRRCGAPGGRPTSPSPRSASSSASTSPASAPSSTCRSRSAGTEFEREVWAELERIPYGQTTSYGEIARQVGRPDRARAVGLANGRNPISMIVPCHRVIGAAADSPASAAGWNASGSCSARGRARSRWADAQSAFGRKTSSWVSAAKPQLDQLHAASRESASPKSFLPAPRTVGRA